MRDCNIGDWFIKMSFNTFTRTVKFDLLQVKALGKTKVTFQSECFRCKVYDYISRLKGSYAAEYIGPYTNWGKASLLRDNLVRIYSNAAENAAKTIGDAA